MLVVSDVAISIAVKDPCRPKAGMVIDLPPEDYTASVRGANDSAGIALLEIYLVE